MVAGDECPRRPVILLASLRGPQPNYRRVVTSLGRSACTSDSTLTGAKVPFATTTTEVLVGYQRDTLVDVKNVELRMHARWTHQVGRKPPVVEYQLDTIE